MGFLDVSGLAFAAANLMQTLRTVPCTHAPDQRCGRKRPKFEENKLLAGYSSPEHLVRDHKTSVAEGSFCSSQLSLEEHLKSQTAVFWRSQRLHFSPCSCPLLQSMYSCKRGGFLF